MITSKAIPNQFIQTISTQGVYSFREKTKVKNENPETKFETLTHTVYLINKKE
jgi:hypothetical protein